ncbi:MAG: glycoside hydrolase domain-containing protein [Candidatus Ratteibacteria bacterium]
MLFNNINLYGENSGNIIPATISKPIKITKKSDEKVEFTGEYKIEKILFKFDGYMEFDGMIYYKMNAIVPEKENINFDRIYLSIPVNEKNAKYFFSTAGGWSPAFGEINKEGIIWKSDEIADFVPYVCLTDDKVALHWFSDNDHNWILGNDYPTCEIIKVGKVVEMRINFVRKKGKIKNFDAEFGLIASPVKPLPSGWRNACLHFVPIGNSKINFFYGPGHGGCPIDPHDTKKLAQAMGVYKEGENPDQILINLPENYINWSDPEVLKNAEKVLGKNGVEFIKNWQKAKNNPDPYKVKRCYFFNASMYFEGYKSKAFSTFFPAEWTLVPQSWFHLTPVESYRDFLHFIWKFGLDIGLLKDFILMRFIMDLTIMFLMEMERLWKMEQ